MVKQAKTVTLSNFPSTRKFNFGFDLKKQKTPSKAFLLISTSTVTSFFYISSAIFGRYSCYKNRLNERKKHCKNE